MHRLLIVTTLAALIAGAAGCGPRNPDARAAESRTAVVHPWCDGADGFRASGFTLTSDSLGPVVPGTTRAALASVCPTLRDTTLFDASGETFEGSVLRFHGVEVGVVEWSRDGTVDRVLLTAPEVVTERGIRVGSTVRDLREIEESLQAGYDDEGTLVWSEAEPGISYRVAAAAEELFPSPDDVALYPERIPGTAPILHLLLSARDAPLAPERRSASRPMILYRAPFDGRTPVDLVGLAEMPAILTLPEFGDLLERPQG